MCRIQERIDRDSSTTSREQSGQRPIKASIEDSTWTETVRSCNCVYPLNLKIFEGGNRSRIRECRRQALYRKGLVCRLEKRRMRGNGRACLIVQMLSIDSRRLYVTSDMIGFPTPVTLFGSIASIYTYRIILSAFGRPLVEQKLCEQMKH